MSWDARPLLTQDLTQNLTGDEALAT